MAIRRYLEKLIREEESFYKGRWFERFTKFRIVRELEDLCEDYFEHKIGDENSNSEYRD